MQVLAHNLVAQFTGRQLNISTDKKTKSSEKLSSGYKINRSADDAAGLQMSEKMRSQIRGLNQASENIQDGISLCQVADGALNESHAVLQRMRELSVQAANDTNSDEDRKAIQQEIDQLTKEVDRIANDTNFNNDIYPLNATNNISNSTNTVFSFHIYEQTINFTAGTGLSINGVPYTFGDPVSLTGLTIDGYKMVLYNGGAINKSVNWLGNDAITELRLSDLKTDTNGFVYYTRKTDNKNFYITKAIPKTNPPTTNPMLNITSSLNETTGNLWESIEYLKISNNNSTTTNTSKEKLWIQMGAQKGQGMFLNLVDATAKGVGITDPTLDVTNYTNANTSIFRLDNAISKVSSYRSSFGSQQNRLEYGKLVDNNTAENTQTAESKIRDADMANEMVNYSKNNILEQVGQAMLAQANQNTQNILSLLS